MKSYATNEFWKDYAKLPERHRKAADRQFALFDRDPTHPSLFFKKIKGDVWSARINDDYRVIGTVSNGIVLWQFAGNHSGYDDALRKQIWEPVKNPEALAQMPQKQALIGKPSVRSLSPAR